MERSMKLVERGLAGSYLGVSLCISITYYPVWPCFLRPRLGRFSTLSIHHLPWTSNQGQLQIELNTHELDWTEGWRILSSWSTVTCVWYEVCLSVSVFLGSSQSWRTFQLVGGETFDELYCQVTIFSSHGAIQFNSNKYLLKIVCQGLWETSKEKSLKPKILDVWEPRHGFLGQSDNMRWGEVTLGF